MRIVLPLPEEWNNFIHYHYETSSSMYDRIGADGLRLFSQGI